MTRVLHPRCGKRPDVDSLGVGLRVRSRATNAFPRYVEGCFPARSAAQARR